MRIAIFEDESATNFAPIALLRPVFELLCGHFSARERMLEFLPVSDWAAFVRSELADVYCEEHPGCRVNNADWLHGGPTLLINGRWLADPATYASIRPDTVGIIDGTVAYLTLDPLEAALLSGENWDDALPQIARTRTPQVACGKTLEQSGLRSKFGITVVGVKRRGEDFTYARPETSIVTTDELIVSGPTSAPAPYPSTSVNR